MISDTRIDEIISENINKIISEAEYNYHIGNLGDTKNVKPYYSDSKAVMSGRDTGHFGSGLYFSTYNGKYSDESNESGLIKIGERIYRVDFDLYKNLYRVTSQKHGDMLFNTLRTINRMYYSIVNGLYNCSREYDIISRNCDALGLKCPTYGKLMRMAQELSRRKDDRRSFSTVFMEMNGFNGVNVSGIEKYDNTLHGSVIYDMSKIDKDSIQQVNVNYKKFPFRNSEIATDDEWEDIEYKMLSNPGTYFTVYYLSKLPKDRMWRMIKESESLPSDFYAMGNYFDKSTIKRCLRLFYSKFFNHDLKNYDMSYKLLCDKSSISFLYNEGAFYYANIVPLFYTNNPYDSILIELISEALWEDNPSPVIENIFNQVKRKITPAEQKVIDKWINEI